MTINWDFFGGTGQDGSYNMNPDFLRMLAQMGTGFGKGQSAGEAIGAPTSEALRMQALQGKNPQTLKPTPPHMEGPDEIKTVETADGITKTIKMPSQSKLASLNYGSSPAPESVKAPSVQGGVSDQSPFWKALLGQIS